MYKRQEQEVKDLEKSIRSLGPVNLDAIEQFDEVHERLEFLNSQRDDILSAKNLLLETITEMNDCLLYTSKSEKGLLTVIFWLRKLFLV